ncbi:autotransporter domain-containing protein [Brevundimonas lenta]|uniref:Uncharacterized protein with beta-barrel porin domain n=1 Tax=Brevundimonas lenta TaxID=424796 RepID=A0A7W6NQY5_9CAUL|nr:autotransporter domain-containing protein [Brevundimonas lenta]MBB4083600.1 uncharacterized protein with beta-barrel porin domain [Brevundimonas lenta]
MRNVPAFAVTSRSRRTALQTGAAAVALLAFSALPALAAAQDAPPDEEPLTIEVGDIFTNDYAAHGVVGVTTSAPISVTAGTIVTEGPVSHGIVTYSETGSTTVTAAAVGTFGDESIGIAAQSQDGDVTVNVGQVLTTGAISDAVIATSLTGDVNVTIGSTRTEGRDAWGLWAVSETGQTTVKVGSVETLRDGGIGLVVGGGAGASVTVDSVKTSGYGSVGVNMIAGNFDYGLVTFGDAVLRAGSIETKGAHATAVSVVAVGNADVAVADTRTYGEFADGVTTYSRYGDSLVVVDKVHTSGFSALGVRSGTDEGDLTLTVGEVLTEGELSAAVSTRVRTGDLNLVVGDVTTRGGSSYGVISTVLRGTANITAQGVIQTSGDYAYGIMAATAGHTSIAAADIRTTGVSAIGIDVFSAWADFSAANDRSIDIVAASITTEGDNAHGINIAMPQDGMIIGSTPDDAAVRPRGPAAAPVAPAAPGDFSDDITIRAGKIVVGGEGAVGIRVQGLGAVDIEADNITSEQAEAIIVDARGDSTIKLNGAVSGGGEAAIRVTAENVNVTVAKTAVVTGAGDALVLSAVGPWTPPPEEPLPEEPGVLAPASPGIATLDNAGVIRAGTGAAIRVTSGTAMINNSGRIEGSLILGDGDDQVVNTGTQVVTANNDFGTGTDLFTNKGGTVLFGKAAAPLNISFLGLERFANEGGLIDLRNERAGDTLTLSGAYAATGDARLALDVGPTAVDSLVVQGVASGKTSIVLQTKPEDATLLDKSLRLITVGQGSAAGAFTLADADVGLVRYGLTFDSKTNAYMLDSSAGESVYQSVLAGEGLVSAWRASADAFNAEQAMARASGGDRGRVWAQAHGSMIEREGDDPAFALDYEQELVGGQMGVSLGARPMFGGQASFGLTGGYVDSTLTFDDGGQKVDMRTINGGAYGAWRVQNLFATGLIKVDQHELEIDDNAGGFEADIDGLSWGVQVAAGYRFHLGSIAFEPTVGLDYLSSTLDDLNVLKQSVSFEDRNGLSARFGGQALSRQELAEGRAVTWSAGLEAVHDFDADSSGVLHSKDESDTVQLGGSSTWARAQLGVQYEIGNGLETYVQGEGRFGDGQSGGGVRIGARYRF